MNLLSNLGRNKRRKRKINLIIFISTFVLQVYSCHESIASGESSQQWNKQWGKWEKKLSEEDLADLQNILPLIASGAVWSCPRPLFDLEAGITRGKSIKEIQDMMEQLLKTDLRKNVLAAQEYRYCLERINFLRPRTVLERFFKLCTLWPDIYGVQESEWRSSALFISELVTLLCPTFAAWSQHLPATIISEVVDMGADINNMFAHHGLRVHWQKACYYGSREIKKKEFRLIIDSPLIERAIETVRRADPTFDLPVFQPEQGHVLFLFIEMMPHNFPIETKRTATLVRMIRFSVVADC
ncbi:MAG: hypothetical protein LBR92_04400 [Puniceicoccales bacterium]|jgi:hypothetical protein|nr:hypothetical protein [Puniceicoccales bacterium]